MLLLILGLLLFLGTHSLRMFADGWRSRQIALRGELTWKIGYSALSAVGLLMIVLGYGQARLDPVWLWQAPVWTRHLAALLTLPAFVLLVATYLPGTHIKARIGHPMLAGVKLWAFAHLIANGTLADLLLFGGFLAWAIADFVACRRRDRAAHRRRPPAALRNDAAAVAIGLLAWFAFARYLHAPLFGVTPFG
ncbi:NnrU family protein [Thauera sp. CAU 1555]|uniref:NnrU family protein n=1 Tax=Thauera sedimentorum TaxID=2767595 RepID=A0ABR9B9Z8_9RHOO|nr:NnrU family protein [Thauera sedimentorum]MBC9071406.1 NnrU family protein [Thauera sedimentorum]MBD8502325.1 NnrU family protein [Thauera sedimentorum]